jgi:hypothetical protein
MLGINSSMVCNGQPPTPLCRCTNFAIRVLSLLDVATCNYFQAQSIQRIIELQQV